MLSRLLLLAVLVAVGCTATEPPPAATRPAPSEPVRSPAPAPAEVVAEPPAALALSTLPWVWYHTFPAVLAGGLSQVGVGPVAHDHRVGNPQRYTARRDDHGIELVREYLPERGSTGEPTLLWRRRVTSTAAFGDPVLQLVPSTVSQLVVALRVPGGYELQALTDEGNIRFSSIVLDPPGFAAQGAALQLGRTEDGLVVYVRNGTQAYLDEIDRSNGRPVARASFDPSVLFDRFDWPSRGPRGHDLGHRWPAQRGAYVLAHRGKALELRATDHLGKPRWHTTLDPEGGRWWNTAALIEHDDHVVIVLYNGASSGATAYGVDRESGALRFTSSSGGIGPIGHSRYSNEVALGSDDLGHVLVYGHESGGDYLGVLDVQAGRLLGHEVWRD